MRQLSNSLLYELDEAIKELPGSSGVQKLLVTRVLDHLDRTSKSAAGDRLVQLDLANAYTRLGNIQGNPYDQNLGDRDGALVSIDKALAIATSLTGSAAFDREAVRALASVEQARSEVLWGEEKTPEAVASMQAATQAFERLIAGHDATPVLICEAASAYGTLGDELGQPGTPSMGELAGALAAYRRTLQLYDRALGIDPNFARARRGLSVSMLKIGTIEIETDPAQALKDFELAEQRYEALPDAKQNALSTARMRANLLRKRAMAMRELGEFVQAAPLFDQALTIQKQIAAADPKDSRSLVDVYVDFTQAAYNYEDAADPALEADPGVRRRNLILTVPLLKQAESIMLQLLKQNSGNDDWRAMLADAQVRLGTVEQTLSPSDDSAEASARGLAALKELAAKHPDTALILDSEVGALLSVKPLKLRDPHLAVIWTEHQALLTKRKEPSVLHSLAQAYRSAGQIDKARAVAAEGLALFSPAVPGAPIPRIRRLLELEQK